MYRVAPAGSRCPGGSMPPNTETRIVTQPKGERFALDHAGEVGLYGDKGRGPLLHQMVGQIVHGSAPGQPLVHMISWEAGARCPVELSGRVTLAGDERTPVHVTMRHM